MNNGVKQSQNPIAGGGLDMPCGFPSEAYSTTYWIIWRIHRLQIAGRADISRARALDAWMGLAYRFRSCAEHDETFRCYLSEYRYTIFEPGRYLQERELTGFFVDGLSAIECLSFSLYSMAAMLNPREFREDPRVTPTSTAQLFQRLYPDDPVTVALCRLVDREQTPEFAEWSRIRNILAHRVAPTRNLIHPLWAIYEAELGEPAESIATKGIPMGQDLTAARLRWLGEAISAIVSPASEFAKHRFPVNVCLPD